MSNRNGHEPGRPFVRPPSELQKLQLTVGKIIDMVLAMHALAIERNIFTHEELKKMSDIVAQVRPKLSQTFTVEEGLKSIRAAFRIEVQGKEPPEVKDEK